MSVLDSITVAVRTSFSKTLEMLGLGEAIIIKRKASSQPNFNVTTQEFEGDVAFDEVSVTANDGVFATSLAIAMYAEKRAGQGTGYNPPDSVKYTCRTDMVTIQKGDLIVRADKSQWEPLDIGRAVVGLQSSILVPVGTVAGE